MNPQAYCLKRTRDSGSSFFYAFRFLPETRRRAMMVLYAFCREVDDVADEIEDKQEARRQMQQWRDEVHAAFHGTPEHPVGREVQWARQHFSWDEELFYELIDGMLMDISSTIMVKPSDLQLYCYRVAGVVGLLSIEVFGYQHRQARNFACSLGEALQLTNILRDIPEDMQRGRIYLPQEIRARFAVTDQDIYQGNMTEGMQAMLQYYAEKTEAKYQQALQQLPMQDRISLRPSLLMAAIYHTQLQRMQTHHMNIWKHSGRVSTWQKLRTAWQAWRYEKAYERSHDAERYPLKFHF